MFPKNAGRILRCGSNGYHDACDGRISGSQGDSWQWKERCRNDSNHCHIANAFAEDKRKTMEAGMNAHLSKPLNVPELMDTIRKFCDGK